jgi:hypothetical protein
MTPAKILLLIEAAKALAELIAKELDTLRAKGELTPELEAAYQQRQEWVFSRPEMKPESAQPDPARDPL